MPHLFDFTRRSIQYPYNNLNNTRPPTDASYPLSVTDYRSGFLSIIMKRENYPSYSTVYLEQNHHEKFNYQGVNYWVHSPYEVFTKESAFHQTIANHSIIVYVNPRKIIIDEALESYPPER
jgi:hypothetical protein